MTLQDLEKRMLPMADPKPVVDSSVLVLSNSPGEGGWGPTMLGVSLESGRIL